MNEEPQGVAPGHNPDRLTVAQVGAGWRLLEEDEVHRTLGMDERGISMWMHGEWDDSIHDGDSLGCTYRTRLSREELRAARGLDPAPAPEPLCVCGHEKWAHRFGVSLNECGASVDVDGSICKCWLFRPAQGESKCPKCGHAVHLAGRCLNMASDSDCNCDHGTEGEVLFSTPAQEEGLHPQFDSGDYYQEIANEAEPAPAQAISAEERARECLDAIDSDLNNAFHGGGQNNCVQIIAAALTAHAAQEVSRVEEACRKKSEALLSTIELAVIQRNTVSAQLAQLRETLAQKEGELRDVKEKRHQANVRALDLKQSLARVEKERDAEFMQLRAAERMAKAVDDAVENKVIGSRSAIADARLDFGDPFKYPMNDAITAERDALKAQVALASAEKGDS